jgi:hypothetical protein
MTTTMVILSLAMRPGTSYWSTRSAFAHQQGVFEALEVSDFLTQQELHRTRLYDRRYRP